ncbi:MAG TPA: PHB depolymerase family esterase [Blastocatellia bacterium]|nr:PHB depolymerase family esterase [Blastocatellia bacterium]
MRKRLASLLIIWSWLAMPASSLVQPDCPPNRLGPGDYTLNLRSGGIDRVYDLHIPTGLNSAQPAPLVVDIHPYTQTKEFQARQSDFNELSRSNGFVVAHPQGIDRQWNAGDAIFLGDRDIDDVEFIRALVTEISQRVRIDHSRIYATGHSNGSMLSHRLACEAADLFAGVAGMSGGLQFRNFNNCRPARPISIKMYHGLSDQIVPYRGGRTFRPIRETFEFWAKTNRCSGAPRTTTGGLNRCETYTDCAGGTEVSLCSMVANHINIYRVRSLNVSEDAWAFFKRFRLPLPDRDRDGVSDVDECRFGTGAR